MRAHTHIHTHTITLIVLICDFSNLSNELKPKWMTPAMEEVARLRKKITEASISVPDSQNSLRVTRSRVAKKKRKIVFHTYICIHLHTV